MSQTHHDPPGSSLPAGAESYLRANRYVPTALEPLLDTTGFRRSDLDQLGKPAVQRLIADGILKHDGDELHDEGPGHSYRHTWRINQAAKPIIRDLARTRGGPWPRCTHGGLTNHGDGRYGCGHPDCTERYTRAEAEEVDL